MRLSFRRWPVRWRIAGVSAGLTLVILVCFAAIVGSLASERLESDFEDDLLSTANQILANYQLQRDPAEGIDDPDLEQAAMAGDAVVRLVDGEGTALEGPPVPDLGPPETGIESRAGFGVVALPLARNSVTGQSYFLQYGRSRASLEATVDRLWLLLAGGVVGGTLLATLAGLAVARRAMRPISSLTAAARQITMTRDPSLRLPEPETEDEVAELTRTLDQMLRELDAARAETEQMVQAQRDFVADASHELRTPLTSVLANLELLEASLAGADADPDDEAVVGAALASSRRMRRLVGDLLLLARADAGRAGPRRGCDLAEIADAALAEVRPVAGERELSLLAEGPVVVDGNPDDLHRMALNLLENAVRHTPPRTAVEVTVRRHDREAVLEVSDDGPGIPGPLGDQIFSRFVRGEGPADLAADSGTGLGLAIVKAVATSHGGSVAVGRSPSGGARFEVRLPGASRASAARGAPAI